MFYLGPGHKPHPVDPVICRPLWDTDREGDVILLTPDATGLHAVKSFWKNTSDAHSGDNS